MITLTNLNDVLLKSVKDLESVLRKGYTLDKEKVKLVSLKEKLLNFSADVDRSSANGKEEFYVSSDEDLTVEILLPPFESRAFEVIFSGCESDKVSSD